MKGVAKFCIAVLIRWLTLIGAAAVFNLLVPFPVTWGLVGVSGVTALLLVGFEPAVHRELGIGQETPRGG